MMSGVKKNSLQLKSAQRNNERSCFHVAEAKNDHASDQLLSELHDKVLLLKTELGILIQQQRLSPPPSPQKTSQNRFTDSLSVLDNFDFGDHNETTSFNLADLENKTVSFLLGNKLNLEEQRIISTLSNQFSSSDDDEQYLSEADDPLHNEETLNQLFFTSEIMETRSNEVNNCVSKKQKDRVTTSHYRKATAVKATTKFVNSGSNRTSNVKKPQSTRPSNSLSKPSNSEPSLFYCLLHISSGLNFVSSTSRNLYLVCRTFTNEHISQSDVSWNCIDPRFNFKQIIPVTMNCNVLKRLQNNFMVVEVWEKKTTNFPDQLYGICKLPVHLFYLSFRDKEVLQSVIQQKKPVIAVDDLLPLMNLTQNTKLGDLDVFLAMGTESQMEQYRKSSIARKVDRVHPVPRPHFYVSHVFTLSSVVVELQNPPGSLLWGESDCFVEYVFMKQAQQKTGHDFCLCYYKLKPRLCEPVIQFEDVVSHRISLPKKESLENILTRVFTEGGIEICVFCRYYYPQEHDVLVAKTFLPIRILLSVVTSRTKCFTLKLTRSSKVKPANKGEAGSCIGEMKLEFSYAQSNSHDEQKNMVNNLKSKCESVFPVGKNVQEHEEQAPHQFDTVALNIFLQRASNLPLIQHISRNELPPNACVSLSSAQEKLTQIFMNSTNPYWNWEGTINVPLTKLEQVNKYLTLNVWHVDAVLNKDYLLGTVSVDLNPLYIGLNFLYGWYNIIDYRGLCQGQIQLKVSLARNVDDVINREDVFVSSQKTTELASAVYKTFGSYSVFPSHIATYSEQSITVQKSKDVIPIPSSTESRSFLLKKLTKSLGELENLQESLNRRLEPAITPKQNGVRSTENEVTQADIAKSSEKCQSKCKTNQLPRLAAAIFK